MRLLSLRLQLPLLLLSSSICPAAFASWAVKRAAVNDCLTDAGVPQLDPASDGFDESIIPYNLRVPFTPVGLAVPETVTQVQDAVSCGVSHGVTVSARGGGHSYISNGLGGEDGHLVIDMGEFTSMTVDESTGVATIGSGLLIGEIALFLYDNYGLAMAHGTCPSVGIAGLTLHGGYGLSSRTHGLSLDVLVEAEVVLADSSVVNASETENADLFWALRGAGPSFGIVTSFKFSTFAAPEANVAFTYNLTSFGREELKSALWTLQRFTIDDQPAEMDMRIFLQPDVQLRGIYHGELSDYDAVMQPLLSELGNPPSSPEPEVVGWIESLEKEAYGPMLPEEPMHNTFFAKSLMPAELSEDAISAAVDYYFDETDLPPDRAYYLLIDFHGGKSSAITQVSANATSYAHRRTIFKLQFLDAITTGDPYPEDGFGFLNGWVEAIAAAQGVDEEEMMGMYANYADSSLTADEAHQAYWLDHYERLSTLKDRFDPDKVFMNPQGINS